MVGDSAALFTRYMEEYGTDYGMAARNIGRAFATTDASTSQQVVDGSITQTILSGQRLLEAITACLPLGIVAVLVTLSSNLVVVASHIYQARQRNLIGEHTAGEQQQQQQHQLSMANHLFQTTRPDVCSNLVAIAAQYGRQDNAQVVFLVVPDSYQAVQLRLCLCQQQKQQYPTVQVFETLQDALNAASTTNTDASNGNDNHQSGRVLIYFHSLVPTVVTHNLKISNCPDFVLRADYGGSYQPQHRLILTGKIQISNSHGTINSVAIPTWEDSLNSYGKDNSSVQLIQCRLGPMSTTTTILSQGSNVNDSTRERRSPTSSRLLKTAGLCLLAIPTVTATLAMSTLLLSRTARR